MEDIIKQDEEQPNSSSTDQCIFGASISLSYDAREMTVDATGRFGAKVKQGAVYIYDRNEITGALDERTILMVSDPATNEEFNLLIKIIMFISSMIKKKKTDIGNFLRSKGLI